jgi:nucleoside-diphosphate-sugar epimerase
VEAARRSRVDHIVLVSSAEVYGFQELQPVPETAVLAPRSPYGAAKVGAEAVLGAATRSGWFDSTVLRPFSVYGPGQPGHTLLSQLVAAAVAGRRVSVVDPSPVRDFVFVGDVVEAVLAACDRSRSSGSRTRSHLCCNVASGQGRSVGEVAEMVSERFGTGEAPEVAGATRPSDIPMLVGDTARASMVLGVEASTLFADGLELTVDAIGERLH